MGEQLGKICNGSSDPYNVWWTWTMTKCVSQQWTSEPEMDLWPTLYSAGIFTASCFQLCVLKIFTSGVAWLQYPYSMACRCAISGFPAIAHQLGMFESSFLCWDRITRILTLVEDHHQGSPPSTVSQGDNTCPKLLFTICAMVKTWYVDENGLMTKKNPQHGYGPVWHPSFDHGSHLVFVSTTSRHPGSLIAGWPPRFCGRSP